MMKNRDTASNPYRVPRQPTQQWIKVSIAMLFLSNLALMGSVGYLIFATQQCTSTCMMGERPPSQNAQKLGVSSEVKLRDGEESPIVRQEEIVRLLTRRVDNTAAVVSELQSGVRKLDEICRRKIISETPETSAEGRTASSDTGISTRQSSMLEIITQMQLKITNLGIQLKEYVTTAQQVCKKGHYRYGVHCFYVGEAALPQANAKRFCSEDYEAKGTLVMIKDMLTHDIVAAKLPNRLHSYWIGIERLPLPTEVRAPHSVRSPMSDEDESKSLPAPISASSVENPPYGVTTAPFDYVDGTKVQNKVWQKWGSRANRHSDDRQRKNCVALTFDRGIEKWVWQDHDCGARLGYVCQYFIMSVGY